MPTSAPSRANSERDRRADPAAPPPVTSAVLPLSLPIVVILFVLGVHWLAAAGADAEDPLDFPLELGEMVDRAVERGRRARGGSSWTRVRRRRRRSAAGMLVRQRSSTNGQRPSQEATGRQVDRARDLALERDGARRA